MARKRRRDLQDEQPPRGCFHYSEIGDMSWDCQKYFQQRYDIFSRYDDGIWMTEDAWFGVTPEAVAGQIAGHVASACPPGKTTLVDTFSGVGGNVIAFALSGCWQKIVAIEKDAATLACAKHNAAIYGVEDVITWYHGDCFELLGGELANLKDDAVIFASPPWGGPGYSVNEVFDLSKMQPYSLQHLLDSFRTVTNDVALFLPRTSDIRQIAARRDIPDRKVSVMHYCMKGASKGICAYFGDLQV